jgi:hypothetical protein
VPGDLNFHADAAAGEVNPQAAAEADLMGYRHARRAPCCLHETVQVRFRLVDVGLRAQYRPGQERKNILPRGQPDGLVPIPLREDHGPDRKSRPPTKPGGGFQLSRSLLLRKPVGNVLTEFVTNRLRKMRSVVARNYQSPGVGSAAFLAAGPGEGKGQREV